MRELIDRSIQQWGQQCGVTARLEQFFNTPAGRALVNDFQASGVAEPDLDVLIFLLIYVVWAGEEWEKVPRDTKRQDLAKQLRQARRKLYTIKERMHPASVETLTATIKQLEKCERHLNIHPWVQVGKVMVWGHPPGPKRYRAKRQVVFFLTGYFRELGYRHPPWALIFKFLQLVGLEKPTTSPKTVSSWWSNTKKREVTSENPIEPRQKEWVDGYFTVVKKWVYQGVPNLSD